MRKLVLKSGKYFILLILFLSVNEGCNKIEDSVIPSIPFSYTINLTIHNEVNISGNSIFIPEIGYGGVIVYCEFPGSFYAYDAACTYEVSPSCKVVNDGVLGTCKCCKSQYLLLGGGFPSKGPAVEGLRQYQTSMFNGMLRIYNQ